MLVLLSIVAFGASLLTFFAGFGLGTMLLPAFALFFPLPQAVALTAVVHLLNNLFKLGLTGKNADFGTVARFGIPSVLGALVGAYTLGLLGGTGELYTYHLGSKICSITLLKLVMAMLMMFFALMELIPKLKNLRFDQKYFPFGGLLSGFFGGLSGHQGALRSAFLVRGSLEGRVFISTGIVIACMTDLARLPVYFAKIGTDNMVQHWSAWGSATISALVASSAAFAGAWLGNKWLEKTTLPTLQQVVALLLFTFSFLLAIGIL